MAYIKIGKYLLNRLTQIGITHLFGVPGDYNLKFLDQVLNHKNLTWVGTTNELNASYMADGYGRIKGISALLTTYGVGELSALNGIAGGYAENVPIIHLVGCPIREHFKRNMILHHTLGTNDSYLVYKKMSEHISNYSVWLDAKNAINQIDEAIKVAVFYKQPVYIMMPTDVIEFAIDTNQTPLNFATGYDNREHSQILKDLLFKLKNSKQTIIIAGHKVKRYGLSNELDKLVTNMKINVVTTAYGKGVINETNPYYLGLYSGANTLDQGLLKMVDTADLVLTIGNKFTDSTTSFFKMNFTYKNVFEITDTHVKYDNKLFTNHSFGYLLKTLAKVTNVYHGISLFTNKNMQPFVAKNNTLLTYKSLFFAINNFIKENDVIASDIGTSSFLSQFLNLKANCGYILQALYCSIGFSFPASLGAKLANANNRIINIIGDGAFNMSFNELATAIKNKLSMVIFVINNQSYLIEKILHPSNVNASYNQTPNVDFVKLLKAFDPNNLYSVAIKVNNEVELANALKVANENQDKLVLIEVLINSTIFPNDMASYYSKLTNK